MRNMTDLREFEGSLLRPLTEQAKCDEGTWPDCISGDDLPSLRCNWRNGLDHIIPSVLYMDSFFLTFTTTSCIRYNYYLYFIVEEGGREWLRKWIKDNQLVNRRAEMCVHRGCSYP